DHFHRIQQRQSGGPHRCPARRPEFAGDLDRLAGSGHAGGVVWYRLHCAVHFRATAGHAAQRPSHEHRATGDVADGLDRARPDAQQGPGARRSDCGHRHCLADLSQNRDQGRGESVGL
ncbi:membrane protein, putative, partial [Pseudomonas fluorescens]